MVSLSNQKPKNLNSTSFFPLSGEVKTKKKFAVSSLKKALESAQQKHGSKFVEDNLQVAEEPFVCTNGTCKSVSPLILFSVFYFSRGFITFISLFVFIVGGYCE